MKKHEANKAQPKWNKYIECNTTFYGNFEVKYCATNTIPWSRWKQPSDARQLENLVDAQNKGFYWKYSDMDIRQKKFDCSNHKPADGYLCIYWNLHKRFTVIRIGDFLVEKLYSTEKSLSYVKACDIAERIVNV